MNIASVKEEIYRFFPRNVNPYDTAFDLTEEAKNKSVAVPEKRLQIHAKWNQFIDEMNKVFPNYKISDDTPVFDKEFCNYCSFYKGLFKFHVLISLIIPVHTVLISGYSPGDQKEIITCDHEDVATCLNEQGIGNVSIETETGEIQRLLGRIFHSMVVTKKELDKVLVPDVGTQRYPHGNVPLFDLVFTDYLLAF